MAKILIEFDTVGKTAVAKIDGVEVPNFISANLYGGYKNKFGIELVSGKQDDDNDMQAWTRVCANDGQLVDKTEEKEEDKDVLDEETKQELNTYFGIDDA